MIVDKRRGGEDVEDYAKVTSQPGALLALLDNLISSISKAYEAYPPHANRFASSHRIERALPTMVAFILIEYRVL
jgi:hypothetical protein